MPPDLPSPFTTRHAAERGVSRSRLSAADLDARVRGVRSTTPIDGLEAQCRAFLTRLPDDAGISHLTALQLLGAPVPDRFRQDTRIDIAVPAPARAPHAAGIRGHRIAHLETWTRRGIRLSTPATAWIDAGMMLRLPELVAIGDWLVQTPRPIATVPEIRERLDLRPAHLAKRRLLRAVDLLDGRAESYPESILRLILHDAGFPAPEVNRSYRVGQRVVRPDLSYPHRRIAIEYQGDYHRDRRQWLADLQRRLAMEAAGWTVIDVTAADLRDPTTLFTRLRTLLAG